MADNDPEFEDLAKRYLDLWQDQVNAMSSDPNTADALARGIRAFTQGVVGLMAGAAGGAGHAQTGGAYGSAATGAQAFSTASYDTDGDVAKLYDRIAELEKRVAALENPAGKKRSGPRSAGTGERAGKAEPRAKGTVS